jgi:hypothetical protein
MSLSQHLAAPLTTERLRGECARALIEHATSSHQQHQQHQQHQKQQQHQQQLAATTTRTRQVRCAWTVAHVAQLLAPLRELSRCVAPATSHTGRRVLALHTHIASVREQSSPGYNPLSVVQGRRRLWGGPLSLLIQPLVRTQVLVALAASPLARRTLLTPLPHHVDPTHCALDITVAYALHALSATALAPASTLRIAGRYVHVLGAVLCAGALSAVTLDSDAASEHTQQTSTCTSTSTSASNETDAVCAPGILHQELPKGTVT